MIGPEIQKQKQIPPPQAAEDRSLRVGMTDCGRADSKRIPACEASYEHPGTGFPTLLERLDQLDGQNLSLLSQILRTHPIAGAYCLVGLSQESGDLPDQVIL